MELLELNNQLQSQSLFEAFKQQLEKDFAECGCDSAFVTHLTPHFESLKQQIEKELALNSKRPLFNLNQLLYRIDISESQIHKQCNEFKNEAFLSIIAELIIKRILQKIILKLKYKLDGN